MSKLLAQGGYGCIFKPGMYCSGKLRSRDYVSKLSVYDDSAKNELLMSFKIKKIKHYKKYFVPVQSFCHVEKSILDHNKDINKCDIYKKKRENKFVLMKLEYLNSTDISSFFLQYQEKIGNNIFIYISVYKKLLFQIKKLQSVNIVHYDLRPNNILMSNETFNPYIIDFGISLNMKKILNIMYNHKKKIKTHLIDVGQFYRFAPYNCYWCFDIHIINYIIHSYEGLDNKFTYEYEKESFKQFVYENSAFHYLSDKYKALYWDNCIKYLDSLCTLTNYEVLLHLIKNYKRWDITGLSMTFLQLVGYNKQLQNSDIFKQFVMTLFSNVSFDSNNISSIDKNIYLLNKLKIKQD